MRKRLTRITRRSLVGALVGLAFAAVAGVGLAQVTGGTSNAQPVASTTESQTTSTQTTTTGDREGETADDQESESDSEGNDFAPTQSSTTPSTSTTMPATTTSGDDNGGDLGGGQEKMDVCHHTGNGGEHTINIAAPAVPAHTAQGDTMGACAGDTVATTTTSGSKHKPKKSKHDVTRQQQVTSHVGSGSSTHGNSGHASSHAGGSSHAHASSHAVGAKSHGAGKSHGGGSKGGGKGHG